MSALSRVSNLFKPKQPTLEDLPPPTLSPEAKLENIQRTMQVVKRTMGQMVATRSAKRFDSHEKFSVHMELERIHRELHVGDEQAQSLNRATTEQLQQFSFIYNELYESVHKLQNTIQLIEDGIPVNLKFFTNFVTGCVEIKKGIGEYQTLINSIQIERRRIEAANADEREYNSPENMALRAQQMHLNKVNEMAELLLQENNPYSAILVYWDNIADPMRRSIYIGRIIEHYYRNDLHEAAELAIAFMPDEEIRKGLLNKLGIKVVMVAHPAVDHPEEKFN